jgi:hypothetical protein
MFAARRDSESERTPVENLESSDSKTNLLPKENVETLQTARSTKSQKEETAEVRENLVDEKAAPDAVSVRTEEDLESNITSKAVVAIKKPSVIRVKLGYLFNNYIKNFYVERNSRIRVFMDFVMTFVILFSLFEVPYLACFESYTHVGFLVVHILLDFVAYSNMLLHFFDVYEVKGLPVYSRKLSIKRYAAFYLWIDILTYIPVDWFILVPLWRLNRCLSLIRFRIYFFTIEQKLIRWINPLYLRLLNLTLFLVLIIHAFACFLFLQQTASHRYGNFMISDDSMDLFIYNTQMSPLANDPAYDISVRIVQYIGVVAVMVPVTVGYASLNPQDDIAITYCLICVFVGASVYSILLGTVGDIVKALDRSDQVFRDKMDNLSDYLRYRGVSGPVQRDSRKFYSILQRGKRSLDHDVIMGDLDVSIKRKIAQYLHK